MTPVSQEKAPILNPQSSFKGQAMGENDERQDIYVLVTGANRYESQQLTPFPEYTPTQDPIAN